MENPNLFILNCVSLLTYQRSRIMIFINNLIKNNRRQPERLQDTSIILIIYLSIMAMNTLQFMANKLYKSWSSDSSPSKTTEYSKFLYMILSLFHMLFPRLELYFQQVNLKANLKLKQQVYLLQNKPLSSTFIVSSFFLHLCSFLQSFVPS